MTGLAPPAAVWPMPGTPRTGPAVLQGVQRAGACGAFGQEGQVGTPVSLTQTVPASRAETSRTTLLPSHPHRTTLGDFYELGGRRVEKGPNFLPL